MSHQYPKSFFKAVEKAYKKNPENRDDAAKAVAAAIKKMGEYKEWVAELIHRECLTLLHEFVGRTNQTIKTTMLTNAVARSTGIKQVPQRTKVDIGLAARETQPAPRFVDLRFNGVQIGTCTKEDLLELAEQERRHGQAAFAKAQLWTEMANKLPKGKTAGEFFNNTQVENMYLKACKKHAKWKVAKTLAELRHKESKNKHRQAAGGSHEQRVAADAA